MSASAAEAAPSRVDLDIQGMTCASCAARIEKRLNRLDGVTASVNYATERAHVESASGLTPEALIAEVQRTGYDASVPAPERSSDDADARALRTLRTRAARAARCAARTLCERILFRARVNWSGEN